MRYQLPLTVLVGGLAGIAGSLLVGNRTKVLPPGSAQPAPAVPPGGGLAVPEGEPISVPFRRVRGGSSPPTLPRPSPPDDDRKSPLDDLAERHARIAASFEEQIAHHRLDSTDQQWAAAVTPPLKTELARVSADNGARLVDVECRSTSCVANVRFPTFDEAAMKYSALVEHPYVAACARSSYLPTPTNPTAPYDARVLFDCRGWKEHGSQLIATGSP